MITFSATLWLIFLSTQCQTIHIWQSFEKWWYFQLFWLRHCRDTGPRVHWCHFKRVTLHSGLYSHPRPGSRSWPIKFLCLNPWPHWKFGLDPWLFSINHAHQAPGEALTVSKLTSKVCLTAWPAPKFGLDRLTSLWPRSRVGVQSPMQCHPLAFLLSLCYLRMRISTLHNIYIFISNQQCRGSVRPVKQ